MSTAPQPTVQICTPQSRWINVFQEPTGEIALVGNYASRETAEAFVRLRTLFRRSRIVYRLRVTRKALS